MAHNVAAALVKRGHELRAQTAAIKGLPRRESRDGVDIFRTFSFRRRAEFCTVPEMAGYVATSLLPSIGHIKSWRPDIVHAHFAVPTGALALACRAATGAPYALTIHLGDVPGGNPDQTDALFRFLNPAIKPIWKNASAISASSSFAAELARSAYGADPEIILNGIDTRDRAESPRPPSDPLALAAIGRFNPQKNFPWMIRALAGCDFAWHLTLIGEGAQRPEIETAIRECGLAEKVTLAGWTTENEMRETLSRTDVFLMPSTSEGNPVAAIEALKSGAAILGSDIGGLADLVRDRDNGFAVPTADYGPFREKLRALASDHALLARMKSRSLEAAGKFDIGSIAAAYESFLARACGK